jgi:hypothetical protein
MLRDVCRVESCAIDPTGEEEPSPLPAPVCVIAKLWPEEVG